MIRAAFGLTVMMADFSLLPPVTGLSRGASTAVVDSVAPSRMRGSREITSAAPWLSAGRRLLFPLTIAGTSSATGFFRLGRALVA
jgi:hypothetical protein